MHTHTHTAEKQAQPPLNSVSLYHSPCFPLPLSQAEILYAFKSGLSILCVRVCLPLW